MGVGGLSWVPLNQSQWVTFPPPSRLGWAEPREGMRLCEAGGSHEGGKGFIYFLLLGVSLRALDRSLEGFIPLLNLVNGRLAGLRGHGRRLGSGREGSLLCPSTHSVNRHCWRPPGCWVPGSKHTQLTQGRRNSPRLQMGKLSLKDIM